MNIRSIAPYIVAILAAVAISNTAATKGMGKGQWHGRASVQGSWEVRLTPVDCATGDPAPQFAFDSYLTFGDGGTLVESTSNPNFQPGQRGSGHGYWDRSAPGSYAAVFQAFVHFDGGNRVRGTQRVESELELLDDDHWQGTAVIEFYDTADALYFTGCADTAAARIS